MTPYYDSRTKTFNHEYTHKGWGDCVYCGLRFAHIHPPGGSPEDFTIEPYLKTNLPSSEERG